MDNYSNSVNNINNFTNEQIISLYKLYKQKELGGKIGFILHIPRTTEEAINFDFLKDSIVECANEYFEEYSTAKNYAKV